MKVILIRHGESEANFENYWTGWLDVDLTTKGLKQAQVAGEKIATRGLTIDVAFESVLKRSIKTAKVILNEAQANFVPEFKTWRLNERHYGQLVGKNKAQMTAEFGAKQVEKWRRGYTTVPPLVEKNHFDRRYATLDPRLIPLGESLQQTLTRVLPLWEDQIALRVKLGQTVLVCGHGNSLRALIKYLDQVADDAVNTIDVPNATPVVYTFDAALQVVAKEVL
ncbi:2,3-bisphosphoglycerate-dependent phosphoglycerate mutase [Enterococcus sp. CSURQ0835]|uniref:2,3-bisphosphoglycerate-dependent phosphoglycerate mutase n=1 Tax=Enterococcus sp. CSURQ0835 TaxID=2681394 RepID=UPI00135C9FCA|nr:2,3-diphosphoglycerate-dependent phosphoglycerate mutase [Enterococcus sp. CSURQ0835]